MSPRSRSVSTALGVLLLFALPLLPEILGTRLLIFRDAQLTHWPWRRVAMAALESGRVPFLNEAASGTQPLLANPNAVLLYPTVLLERVFSPAAAFNLHYLLHVLWAFLGARRLASRLGVTPPAALFAGAAYAFSGMVLSYGSAFFNSSAAAAWLPWCAVAALGVTRAATLSGAARAAAATGLAFGIQLLAGEPALSLLTGAFVAFLALVDLAGAERGTRKRRLAILAGGGAAAGVVALLFAAPLLLPLKAVFPFTYRGQHLYSEKAFGAAPFLLWRALEWLFPRLNGDPSTLNSGAGWVHAAGVQEVVYIWSVTFGVLPLLAVFLGASRRDFWRRPTIALAAAAAAAWLFSLGLVLPFSRALFAIELFRRLRYPIKFYLLTTLCVALLAGFAADRFRPARRSAGRALLLGLVFLLYAAGFAAAQGGWVAGWLRGWAAAGSASPEGLLDALRASIRGDALLGMATVLILAAVVFARRPAQPGYVLAILCAALALPWALPLFVSASVRDMTRPPALLSSLRGPGRLYVSADLPGPDPSALESRHAGPPRSEKVARALVEELLPATAQPFSVAYLFDRDPDGSYGWYNRLANEAFTASSPDERSRLLRAYGARWVLAAEGEPYPLFRPVTGVVVAGRHLVLHTLDAPVPEIRWAGGAHRRKSLSAALQLLRSDRFDPERAVVLPGREDEDPRVDGNTSGASAALAISQLSPESARGSVQASAAGHVVFARTYFSAWKAHVDGVPARVLVANARDIAVGVPAGRHSFELFWDRTPFHRGVLWQGAALLFAMAVAAARRKV